MIKDLLGRAAESPRKRVSFNIHPKLSDPVNRFLNIGLPGTYVRPHRHRVDKWELVNLIQGQLDVAIFTIDGRLKQRHALGADNASLVEISGGEWHTFIFRAPAAVVLEVKPG